MYHCITWCYTASCNISLHQIISWHIMWCFTISCDLLLHHVMLWYIMWCITTSHDNVLHHVILWCIMWCFHLVMYHCITWCCTSSWDALLYHVTYYCITYNALLQVLCLNHNRVECFSKQGRHSADGWLNSLSSSSASSSLMLCNLEVLHLA